LVGDEGIRTHCTEDELIASHPHARPALEALLRGRLLVARGTPEGPAYELAHEALWRSWETLRDFSAEEAGWAADRRRIAAAAAEWRGLGRAGEALWGTRQPRGLRDLDAARLGPREAEFWDASLRQLRRRRFRRAVAAALVPVVAALGFFVV